MPLFKLYSQNQSQLLPPRLDELIEEDHIARLINYAVDKMSFTVIENTYSAEGQHAYHPKMLAKVLLYGYTTGVRSSRRLADKLKEDIVFIWLAGRNTPNFRTISDFRKNRLVDIKKLFEQVLNVCAELGMIRVGTVSIDGTTIRADANKNKMQYRKLLEKRKQKTREQIDAMFEEAKELDEEEERLYGNTTPHTTGKTLTEEMKQKIKEKMEQTNKKRINVITRRQATLKRQKKK